MKHTTDDYEHRERVIAALLRYGTWLASAFIAVGIALGALQKYEGVPSFGLSGYGMVKTGIALFVFLPIVRVALMMVLFLRERDYVYTAVSALVLAIIATAIMVAL